MNAFQVLGVPITADRDQIRAAYRALARRWHPDRFMDGPERDWANNKMAEINAAYNECLEGLNRVEKPAEVEDAVLEQVQTLMDDGDYFSARKMLMSVSTRCAEWNYLFGALLLRLTETEKALIYLSVAAHQNPDCLKYIRALREAQNSRASLRGRFSARFARRG